MIDTKYPRYFKAIYDNPVYMRRELWVNGEVVASTWAYAGYSNEIYEYMAERFPDIPVKFDPPWKEGQIVGSLMAFGPNPFYPPEKCKVPLEVWVLLPAPPRRA